MTIHTEVYKPPLFIMRGTKSNMAFAADLRDLFNKKYYQNFECSAVIAAAGTSQRMGSEDKLFMELLGVPVLAHTLIAYQNCAAINEIVIVTREESIARVNEICVKYSISKAAKVTAGGSKRLDSVINGVFAVSSGAKLIAIHDGARPCIECSDIEAAVKAAGKFNAAAPAVKVIPTIKRVINGVIIETVNREDLVEIQTPQVFDADLIKASLTKARKESVNVTDDCSAVELLGFPVRITNGSVSNIKITSMDDIVIAEAILRKRHSECKM